MESAPARPQVQIPATPPPAPGDIGRRRHPQADAAPREEGDSARRRRTCRTRPKWMPRQQAPQMNLPPDGAPPPQLQTQEKPKLAFETPAAATVGQGTGKLARPGNGVQDALNSVVHGASGGMVVGDASAASPGVSGGMNAPPMPGRPAASLELLTNAQGVDFKPYLIQVLAAVKQNWFNVWPQSARMGRQGRVTIQFIIDRKGFVPKLVIASASGTDALDHAAVSGISAALPFPQFPTGFTGDQVRLQLNFVYNMR